MEECKLYLAAVAVALFGLTILSGSLTQLAESLNTTEWFLAVILAIPLAAVIELLPEAAFPD